MTKDEALKLSAGQKLDRIVCERVLGFHSFKDYYNGGGHYLRPDGSECGLYELPKVSQRIADAWEVVEKLRSEEWLVCVKHMPPGKPFVIEGSRSEYDAPCDDQEMWHGKAFVDLQFMGEPWRLGEHAVSDNVPHAIALAALKACWQD